VDRGLAVLIVDKPFLLFLNYATLLSLYVAIEASIQVYTLLKSPEDGLTSIDEHGAETFDFGPVTFMILGLMGVFFALGIGSLAGYHWWLVM
jgi:hypothetical protein